MSRGGSEMERGLLRRVTQTNGVLSRIEEGGEGLHGPSCGAVVEGRVAGNVAEPRIRATGEEEPHCIASIVQSCGVEHAASRHLERHTPKGK